MLGSRDLVFLPGPGVTKAAEAYEQREYQQYAEKERGCRGAAGNGEYARPQQQQGHRDIEVNREAGPFYSGFG